MVTLKYVGVFSQKPQIVQQQVAEVAGIENAQTILVHGVELLAAIAGEFRAIALYFLGREPLVFPLIEVPGKGFWRPALLVDVFRLKDTLDQAHLIIVVQDREVRLQADQFRVPAQDLRRDRVESAEIGQALG